MAKIANLRVLNLTLKSPSGDDILQVSHLECESGRLYGVIGTNFSGRSALLRILGGGFLNLADDSYCGQIFLSWEGNNKETLMDTSQYSAYLGPISQDNISTLTNTVEEELQLHLDIGRQNSMGMTVEQCVAPLGLKECLKNNPLQLSGGQTSSLALAGVLLMGRPIVCVDETLMHLDIDLRPQAWSLLKEYAQRGAIVFVADNNYDLMATIVDKAILMRDKKVNAVVDIQVAFNERFVLSQKTVPSTTRFAEELWPEIKELPTSYCSLITILRNYSGFPRIPGNQNA